MTELNWTSPDLAVTAEGHFVIKAAKEKTTGGETLFSLTFTRTDNSCSRETFTLIGLFTSPDMARLTAESYPRR